MIKITEPNNYFNIKKLRIYSDRIEFAGYETGKLSIFKESEYKIIVKEAGHSYFGGRGMTNYAYPTYYVCKIESKENNMYTINILYEIEYDKQSMKDAKNKAIELFNII